MFNRVRAPLKGMVEVPLFNGNKVGQMHDRVRYMCCLLSSCLEIEKVRSDLLSRCESRYRNSILLAERTRMAQYHWPSAYEDAGYAMKRYRLVGLNHWNIGELSGALEFLVPAGGRKRTGFHSL